MDELVIQTHDFEQAKNQIKEFANNTPEMREFEKFRESEGLFNRFNHKVTGNELNNFVATVQKYLIGFNNRNKDFIGVFGQVYNAFEYLDKEYIQGILISVKSAEKASEEAKDAQYDIKRTIDALQITITALKTFKEEVKAYKHLDDIDVMWKEAKDSTTCIKAVSKKLEDTSSELSKKINTVEQFKNRIEKYKHIHDIDSIWDDVKAVNKKLDSYSDKLEKMIAKLSGDVDLLLQFQNKVNGCQHLNDIDKVLDDVQSLKSDLKTFIEKVEKDEFLISSISKDIAVLNDLKENLDECTHLGDIDELWDYSHGLGDELTKATESICELADKYEIENKALSHRLRVSYAIAGGALFIAVLQFILNLVGII